VPCANVQAADNVTGILVPRKV